MRVGWKTTEFWITVLTSIAFLISSLAGSLPPKYASFAAAVVGGLYALSRGLAKLNGKSFTEAVAQAVSALEAQRPAVVVPPTAAPPTPPPA